MSRRSTSKIKQYIRDDRPQRLRSYVRKHKTHLIDIQLKKDRNLLHFCCKHGSSTMLKYLLNEDVDGLHGDEDMNYPLHFALNRALEEEELGKCQSSSECYTGIILPLIERFPDLLDAHNQLGTSCRQLLHRLVQYRESGLEQVRSSGSPCASSSNHGNMSETSWRDKLADEWQHEYSTTWGSYEQDFTEIYSERETYDDWADRIRQQYTARKHARSRPSEDAGSSKRKKCKTEQKTDSQAGPENLEEIRAKMREQYERKNKEDNMVHALKRRMKYEKRYKDLVDKEQKDNLHYDDIPWPGVKGQDGDVSVLFEGMEKTEPEYQKYLRDQRIRWHPDKFMQRFGKFLNEEDKRRILDRVTVLSQNLNKLIT